MESTDDNPSITSGAGEPAFGQAGNSYIARIPKSFLESNGTTKRSRKGAWREMFDKLITPFSPLPHFASSPFEFSYTSSLSATRKGIWGKISTREIL
jgi:hypothetical protein